MVICFDGAPLTRNWPGKPPVFDIKIHQLAKLAVAIGKEKLDLTIGFEQNLSADPIFTPAQKITTNSLTKT
jgi:hypothetical protein